MNADTLTTVKVSYRHKQNKNRRTETLDVSGNESRWCYEALHQLRAMNIPASRVRIERNITAELALLFPDTVGGAA